MNLRHLAVFALALAQSAAPLHAPAAPAPLVAPDFDAYVRKAMRDWSIPGLSVAVVQDGRVYLKGYGVRDIAKDEPVDARTLFAIGSSSKAFTAAALGMLADEKKLTWDDPVINYLPWFQTANPQTTRALTIRDALSHRSDVGTPDALWYKSGLPRNEIIRRIRYMPSNLDFRSHFEYNNIMVMTAGQIVPAVTGMSWDAFIRRRIFEPLQMASTNTSISALRGRSDVAQPYDTIDGTLRQIPYADIDDIGPAGSINSNAEDMSHWLQMLLGNGSYRGRRILQTKTLEAMWTPSTIMPTGMPWYFYGPISHFMDYGMGWILYDYRGHKAIQHAGNIDGMTAMVALLPDQHAGIVILTNKADNFATTAIVNRLWDDLLGSPKRDWSSELLGTWNQFYNALLAEEQKSARKLARGPAALPDAAYAGAYHDDLYGTARVTQQNGTLHFRLLGYDGTLQHYNFETFRLIEPNVSRQLEPLITFSISAAGTAAGMKIGDDPTMVFERVPRSR